MTPITSNSQALVARISAHDKFGSNDINKWIWSHLALKSNLKILEIGCGTGKQTVPLAKLVGDKSQVIAVDISGQSIKTLLVEAKKNLINRRITTLKLNFDDLPRYNLPQVDRILASFSLYYSKKPYELITYLYKILRPGGIIFICGPTKNNNSEITKLIELVKRGSVKTTVDASYFMQKTGLKIFNDFFNKIKISYFENPLCFKNSDSLITYWSSSGLYDPKLKTKFSHAVKNHFKKNHTFITTKKVMGITATK